jgi:hypothetical protein
MSGLPLRLTQVASGALALAGLGFAVATVMNQDSEWWQTWGPNIAVTLLGTAVTIWVINDFIERNERRRIEIEEKRRNRERLGADVATALQDLGLVTRLMWRDTAPHDLVEKMIDPTLERFGQERMDEFRLIYGLDAFLAILQHFDELDLTQPAAHAPSLGGGVPRATRSPAARGWHRPRGKRWSGPQCGSACGAGSASGRGSANTLPSLALALPATLAGSSTPPSH